MSSPVFDEETLSCCVQARLDLGEDPQKIFDDLKGLRVVDISSLRLVMSKIAPDRTAESDSTCPERGVLYRFLRQNDRSGGL
jgi:hypothetical protein